MNVSDIGMKMMEKNEEEDEEGENYYYFLLIHRKIKYTCVIQ